MGRGLLYVQEFKILCGGGITRQDPSVQEH
jgi:hypothetical protein